MTNPFHFQLRITLRHMGSSSGGDRLVVQTRGGGGSSSSSPSVRHNVLDVFGAAAEGDLKDLSLAKPSDEDLDTFSLSREVAERELVRTWEGNREITAITVYIPLQEGVSFEGLVSTCAHGKGRSAPDRQVGLIFILDQTIQVYSALCQCPPGNLFPVLLHQLPPVRPPQGVQAGQRRLQEA